MPIKPAAESPPVPKVDPRAPRKKPEPDFNEERLRKRRNPPQTGDEPPRIDEYA